MVPVCVRCILFLLLSVSFAVVRSEPESEYPSGKDVHPETSEGRDVDKRGIQERQFHDEGVSHGEFNHYSVNAPMHNFQYHIGFQNSEKTHEYLIKHHSPSLHYLNHGSFQSEGPLKLLDFPFNQPHDPYTHDDHSSFYYKPNEEHIHAVPEGIHFHYEFSKGHHPGLENYGVAHFKSEPPKEYSSFGLDHTLLPEKPLIFNSYNFQAQNQHDALPQKDEKSVSSKNVKTEQNISIRQSNKNKENANRAIESDNKKNLNKPDRERKLQPKDEKSKEYSTEARNVDQGSQIRKVKVQKNQSESTKSSRTTYSENKKEILSNGPLDNLSGSPSVKHPNQENPYREVKYQVRPSEKYDNQQNIRSKSHYFGTQFRQTPQIDPSRQNQTQRTKGIFKSTNAPKSSSVNSDQKGTVGEQEPFNKPHLSYRDRKIPQSNKYTTGKENSYNIRSTTKKPRTVESPSAYRANTEKKVPFNFENAKPNKVGVPVKSIYPTEQIQGEEVIFTTINREPFALKLPFANPSLFNGREAIPNHFEPDEAYSSQDETPYAAPVKITYKIKMVNQDPRASQEYTHDEHPGGASGLYEPQDKTKEPKVPQHSSDGREFGQEQKINYPHLRNGGLDTVSPGNSLRLGFHFTNSDGRPSAKDYRTYLGLDSTQGSYLEKGYRAYSSEADFAGSDEKSPGKDQRTHFSDTRLTGTREIPFGNNERTFASYYRQADSNGRPSEKDYRTYIGLDSTQGSYLEKGYRAYSSGARFGGSDERAPGKDQRTHSSDTRLAGPREIPVGNNEGTYAYYRQADLNGRPSGKDLNTNLPFDNSQIRSSDKDYRPSYSDVRLGDSHGRFSEKEHNIRTSELRFSGSNAKASRNNQKPYSSEFNFTNADGRLEEQDQRIYPSNINFESNLKFSGKGHRSYSPDFSITDSDGRPQRKDLRPYASGILFSNSGDPSAYDSDVRLRNDKLFDKEQRDLHFMDLEGRLTGKHQRLENSDLGKISEKPQRGYGSELNLGGQIESISEKEQNAHGLEFSYRGSNGKPIRKDQMMQNSPSRKPKKYYPDIVIKKDRYTQEYSHHKPSFNHEESKKHILQRSPRSSVQYHLPNVNPGNLHQLVDLGDFFKILRETASSDKKR